MIRLFLVSVLLFMLNMMVLLVLLLGVEISMCFVLVDRCGCIFFFEVKMLVYFMMMLILFQGRLVGLWIVVILIGLWFMLMDLFDMVILVGKWLCIEL